MSCASGPISTPRQFLGNYFIRCNVTRKPFNDVRVRLALLAW